MFRIWCALRPHRGQHRIEIELYEMVGISIGKLVLFKVENPVLETGLAYGEKN